MTRTALLLIVAVVGGGAVTPLTQAKASECYAVRDYDKRLECLAVERAAPEVCMSIRDWDAREVCRQRARREQRGSEPRW